MRNTRFQACLAGRGSSHAPYIPRQNGRIVARAPLSDQQYAYLLGELSGTSLAGPALFYEEYACERLDLIAFSRSLYQLMWRHEILRSTFDASGTMRVHSDLPVPLAYESLRGLPEEVCRRRLAASRDECYRLGTSLVDAAPFAIRVFALNQRTIVQVVSRLLAIDGYSGEIFARELRDLLAGEDLPPLKYTFREYRNDAERRKDLPEYTAARAYWLDRLDTLPPAPQLPQRPHLGDPYPRLKRRVFTLPTGLWAAFTSAVRNHGLSPATAVGTAFCEVLRHWAKRPDFTINVLYSDRAPVHPDVSRVIGNFSNSVLLECSPTPGTPTFLDRARSWGKQLAGDLRHSAFSGLSVIRELNQRNGETRDALMPVTFTSTLDGAESKIGTFFEHLGWQRLQATLRAPQVSLNHHLSLVDDRLVAQWDTAEALFVPGVVDDMFGAYEALLTRLATDEGAWHSESFDLTPEARREVRARVNGSTPSMTLYELSTTIDEFEKQLAPRKPSPRGSLVRLGGTNDRNPLVLVHPAGGDLQFYRHVVSAVESRHLVYGLSAVQRRISTIEEMAAQYLSEVLAVSEDRPVRLAGWALGGVVAYEMGRRLLRERRDCTVVMIDPWVGRKGGKHPCEATLVKAFLYHLAESEVDLTGLGIHPEESALAALQRIWTNLRDDLAVLKSLRFDELAAMYRTYERNTGALLRYAVTAEPGLPVQVIAAQERLGGPAGTYLSPLRETMPGFATTLSLPGNHFTLLQMRTARQVADLL